MKRLLLSLLTVLLAGCSAGQPTAPADTNAPGRSQLVTGVSSGPVTDVNSSSAPYTPPTRTLKDKTDLIKVQWAEAIALSSNSTMERNNRFNSLYDDWLGLIDDNLATNEELEKYTGINLCDMLQRGYQAAYDVGNGVNIKGKRQAMTYWKCPNVPR